MINWHIVTCEYPPQIGGVSDYTRLLSRELRKTGDDVHIWAPQFDSRESDNVHRVLGDFSTRDLRIADELLDQYPNPRTLLVQWVPHGFGKRGMNLGFARWIAARAQRGDRLYLMVHEPFLDNSQRQWKHRFVAQVQRRMIRTALRYATRVFISIPAWESHLRPYLPTRLSCAWLPIPATIETAHDPTAVAAIRARFPENALLLGHLGTYAAELRGLLGPALIRTLEASPPANLLLLGNNGQEFANDLRSTSPHLADRIHSTGRLDEVALSHHLSACHVALQPYIDGLSSRRTSLMNVIAHGVATVSNSGHLTEPLWAESHAIALAAEAHPIQLSDLCIELLRNQNRRRHLAEAGESFYRSHFDWRSIVAKLRSPGAITSSNHSSASSGLE